MRLKGLVLVGGTVAAVALLLITQGPALGGPGVPTTTPVILMPEGLPADHPGNVITRAAMTGSDVEAAAVVQGLSILNAQSLQATLAALPAHSASAAEPEDGVFDLATEAAALADDLGRPLTAEERAKLALDAAALPPTFAAETARLLHAIREAAALTRAAEAPLTPDERAQYHALAAPALQAGRDPHLPNEDRMATLAAFEALAVKVDLALIDEAGALVAAALDRYVPVAAETASHSPGASGSVLFQDITGNIVIGGTGATQYTGAHVLIVDLGGPDTYRDTAGGVPPGAHFPVSLVVDVAGNDVYNPSPAGAATYSEMFVQGAAFSGVGALVDLAGVDRYSSGFTLSTPSGDASYSLLYSQGFGLAGVGLLVDADGDDAYASDITVSAPGGNATYHASFVQGSTWSGVGLLLDGHGNDRYASNNRVTSTGVVDSSLGLLAASHCQGAAFGEGVGVLADGSNPFPLAAAHLVRQVQVPDMGGDDNYLSRNVIRSESAASTFGKTSMGQQMSTVCQGVASSGYSMLLQISGVPPAAAVGLLVDVSGSDSYHSANQIRGYGRDPEVETPCVACHVAADLTVVLSTGASGTPPTAPGPATPALVQTGVLVDARGHDRYVTENSIEAYGPPGLRTVPQASATLNALKSLGYGGQEGPNASALKLPLAVCGNLPTTGGPLLGPVGACVTPPTPCLSGGPRERGTPKDGTTGATAAGPIDGVAPVDLPINPTTGCPIGVLADLHGADRYVSDNGLNAALADWNYVALTGDLTLGAGSIAGIGVLADGLTSGLFTAFATDSPLCPLVLGQNCPLYGDLGDTADGNDAYYTGNVLPVRRDATTSNVLLSRNYGFGYAGIGLFADANVPPITTSLAFAFTPAPPLDVVVAKVYAQTGSSDRYSSDNTCDLFLNYYAYGTADTAIAAFADVGGDDRYDQNPACGTSISMQQFGTATTGLAVAFLDLGGIDTYPSGGPAADNTIWALNLVQVAADQLS